MQKESTYMLLTFAAAVTMLLLGYLLIAIRIPREKRTAKLRVARLCLAISYLGLSVPHFIEYYYGVEPDIDTRLVASLTLATAAFQSLLFTATLLTFILPDYVTRRRTLCQMAVVAVAVTIFLVAVFSRRNPYPVLCVGLVAYIGQLIFYTVLFRCKYAESVRRLDSYYAEDESAQLKWVKYSFYAALSIGIIAPCSVYFPSHIPLYFTVVYVIFYAWFASRFFNYVAKLNYYLPAVAYAKQEVEVLVTATYAAFTSVEDEERIALLQQSIDRWIANRGYTKSDVSIERIAAELGTDVDFLRYYFRTRMSSDFRTWRGELRIREAQRIMDQEPQLSIAQVSERVGIIDRSNFRSLFRKIVGMSPTEYRCQGANREG